MACYNSPIYIPALVQGIQKLNSLGDGVSIEITWAQAYASSLSKQVAYNIYYSTRRDDVYSEGVKYVAISPTILTTCLTDFTPGDTYYFAVKATEFDPTLVTLALLPSGPESNLRTYPESALAEDIDAEQTSIPVTDLDEFPAMGIIQIGYELMLYTSKDIPTSSLTGVTRGYNFTDANSHSIDGFDGYVTHDNPFVRFWTGDEENNPVIFLETSKFTNQYAYTVADGYKSIEKDNLNTDLSSEAEDLEDFVPYDLVGYRRGNPNDLLNGKVCSSYFGGASFCADGYGVGFRVRGIPFADENARRLELLLETIGTGQLCVLVKRVWTGIICECFKSHNENPHLRCGSCHGTGRITGYEQYFNPRRADGKILVRFGPTQDEVKTEDDGLESLAIPDCWTLPVPIIHSRDFIIKYNVDGEEEFRYEIQNVTRNALLNGATGAQKFTAVRVRRTDPIYQWRAVDTTAEIPQELTTSIGFLRGANGTQIPHTHTIEVPAGTPLNQINGTTSYSEGHNHAIINGEVQEVLGHTHNLIIP